MLALYVEYSDLPGSMEEDRWGVSRSIYFIFLGGNWLNHLPFTSQFSFLTRFQCNSIQFNILAKVVGFLQVLWFPPEKVDRVGRDGYGKQI